jgi:oligopeptide/dipeptide ABC transporter ATP-binding protein
MQRVLLVAVATREAEYPSHGLTPQEGEEALLAVRDLSVDFVSVDGRVRVLSNIALTVKRGEVVGIVGESGSGKTTLGLAILGLLDSPPAEIVGGSIFLEGRDLLKLGPAEMTRVRGTGINMVFQEPLDSLNPVYRIQSQIEESVMVQKKRTPSEPGKDKESDSRMMTDLLRDLCIDRPEEVLERYPHELSGGMRQRVALSMSIIEKPKLLIADEPTTGLDAYVQNRILGMLSDLRKSGGTLLYITHDLTVASQVCDRLYILYAGRIMEAGNTRKVLEESLHPYTHTLIASVPEGFEDSPALPVQLGEPPNLANLPLGCKFNPRCRFVKEVCRRDEPQLMEVSKGRLVACWKVGGQDGEYNRD